MGHISNRRQLSATLGIPSNHSGWITANHRRTQPTKIGNMAMRAKLRNVIIDILFLAVVYGLIVTIFNILT